MKTNFENIQWISTNIKHMSSYTFSKQCIICVPVYKYEPSDNEKASFIQLCKIIQNSYEICLICPNNLNIENYQNIAKYFNIELSILRCSKEYFQSTETYSYLCETTNFYKCFSEYEYMFIYQLDGWIFKNLLKFYLDLKVDYIGSPWRKGSFKLLCDTIGNGGISLRRVQKFIEICNNLKSEDFNKKYIDKEDLFFCKTIRHKINLNTPSIRIASNFSLTGEFQYFIQTYNNNHMSMCVHAWDKNMDIIKKYIDVNSNLNEINQKLKLKNISNKNNQQKEIQKKNLSNQKQQIKKTNMSQWTNFLSQYYDKSLINVNNDNKNIKNVKYINANSAINKKYAYKDKSILICIFNYKKDDNARHWLNILSPHFDTFVLDSGNDIKNDDFIQFSENIYYGGLFNEFKKIFDKGNYAWGGIICSDVTIIDDNINKFINRVKWLSTTSNIGIWQAAADKSSRSIHGHITENEDIQYKLWIEGWLIFMKNDIIKQMPYILDNRYGWNIDIVSEIISYNLDFLNIIDNNCTVHHPAERGYSENDARLQGRQWQEKVFQTLHLQVPVTIKKYEIAYNNDITFIIVNRGGKHINTVINNFSKTFKIYCNNIKFIVIEQCDDNIFLRGQLYNIAFKYVNTQYISLIDNDIYNLDSFDIIDKYKQLGPFIAFDEVSQIELNNNIYKILSSEKRLGGFGAFNVMKKSDFEKANGFSNLCFGWGAEDNILNEKLKMKRFIHTIGHITHPRRVNDNPSASENNKYILSSYQNHKIDSKKDGYQQTTYNLVYHKNEQNIQYIGVNNISVIDNYEYRKEYNNAYKIANMQYNERIIITMTTWKNRINNLYFILNNLKNQTKLPNLIVINLSHEEFIHKEQDLPIDLLNFINYEQNIEIEINWIDGPNRKQWKKLIPTLLKYPNDAIICIDDDFYYPNDMIETLYNKHLEYPNNPISGNTIILFGQKCHCGCASLVKMQHFSYNLENYLDDDIYNFYSSDIFFTYVASKEKHPYIYCGKEYFTNMKSYNNVDALSSNKNSYAIDDTWNYLVQKYGKIK